MKRRACAVCPWGDLRFSAFMLANCNIAFCFLFAYGDIMKIAKKIGVQ